jgi:hypothetical protein
MPCPDISIATAAGHCRNPAPQRSRCDPVMPHPGAPAHRRVSITNGSADGAAAGCMACLDDHPLGCGPGTSARSKPRRGFLSNVEFLGEVSDVLHSRAPLPLIPPAPFSHKGRRGSLGVLMAEMGNGTQLNAPGNGSPHTMTEIHFGLRSAESVRLVRYSGQEQWSIYLRTAINAQSP